MSECKRQGKKLLEIESQEENNMLSELLYSSSRVTNVMDEVADLKMFLRIFVFKVWTGGVGSNIARKNVWFWHNNTDKVQIFRVVQLKNPRLWNFKTGGEDGRGETGLTEVPLMFRETKPSS